MWSLEGTSTNSGLEANHNWIDWGPNRLLTTHIPCMFGSLMGDENLCPFHFTLQIYGLSENDGKKLKDEHPLTARLLSGKRLDARESVKRPHVICTNALDFLER